MDSLKLTPRNTTLGCGIYEAGDIQKCYTKLFVTEGGRVLPVSHHALSEDDLLTAYKWGREEEQEARQSGIKDKLEPPYSQEQPRLGIVVPCAECTRESDDAPYDFKSWDI